MAEEFSLNEQQEGEFNAFPTVDRKRKSTALVEILSAIDAVRTGAPLEFARAQAERVSDTITRADAHSRAVNLVHADWEKNLNNAIEVSSLPDVHEAEKKRVEGTKFASDTKSPEMYTTVRDKGGSAWDHSKARIASRYFTALKIRDEMFEEADPGFFSIVGDFLDIAVSGLMDAVNLGGFERTHGAQELAGLMADESISEEEFESSVRQYLKDAADSGILQDENFLYLASGGQNLEELGEGVEATLDKLGTTLDIVTIGGFAGMTALRGLTKARSTTALVSAAAGPEESSRVLREATNMPGSSTADNAGVIRETAPSIARHPESFGTEREWWTDGLKINRELETNNTFLDIVNSLGFSRRIDPDVLAEWEPQGKEILRGRIDARYNDNVIDLQITTDQADNLFGSVVYGRSDGKPFGWGRANSRTSRASAQKLANQLNGRVTQKTSDGAAERATQLAKNQRGNPEIAMVRVQEAMGGGVLSPVVERAGDTLHRIFQFANRGEFMRDDALEKIEVVNRHLNDPFGFEKEMTQNMRANAEARGITLAEQQKRVDDALEVYTNQYKELRKQAFNPLQKLIIDGNIAIGEKRWGDARKIWREINDIVSDKSKFNKAVQDLGDIKPTTKVTDPGSGDAFVQTIERGGREYFVVKSTRPMPTEGLTSELGLEEIGRSFFRSFGGTFLTIPRRLDAIAKRDEGVLAIGRRLIEKELNNAVKPLNKLPEERQAVEQIFFNLRDGKDSFRRTPYTEAEFKSEFFNLTGKQPSQTAVTAYNAIQKANDTWYLLKADEMYKRTVNAGYNEMVQFRVARANGEINDFDLVSKRVSREEVDDLAINPITGIEYAPEDIPEGSNIFKVMNRYKVNNRHADYIVLDEVKTRRLYHSDVMGYNPGGPRGYEFLNHYVKQDGRITLLSGRTGGALPKTILGTATRQEALIAADEINNIFRFIQDRIPGVQGMDVDQAITNASDLGDELEEILIANNTWNPSLETVDQFVEFMRKYELHPGRNVGAAVADEPLALADDTGELRFPEKTFREVFEARLNNPRNSTRRDEPLMGFGGVRPNTFSPLDMIQRDFMRVMHNQSLAAYNFQAVNGWLKGADRYIQNKDQLIGMSPLAKMRNAVLSDRTEARHYNAARDAIDRTLGAKTKAERVWEGAMDRVAEWAYDKAKLKTPDLPGELQKIPAMSRVAKMQLSRNPLEFLRGMSFDARLGMFSIDQLIVQSSQAANIMAIVGPRRWPEFSQAFASHVPTRLAIQTINTHGFEGAMENLRAIGRRTSAFTGMTEDEFIEYARFVHGSGRLEVGGEIAELSSDSIPLARNAFGRFRQMGRVFFNEGEKLPRSVATRIAWNEYRKEFPKASTDSNHARLWIASRQDALTAAMTKRSAAVWQKGPLSIPMQFMSYITRMMESLFTDRLLTVKERRRLGAAQVIFWGAAGTGLGQVLDSWLIEGGYELDSLEYTALRYGILDSILQTAFDQESVIGGRLAPAEGIAMLVKNLRDKNIFATLGGPAGQLITDTGQVLVKGFWDAMTGNISMAEADLQAFLRNVSSLDDISKAWMIYNTGDYITRNGDAVVGGLTNTDALLSMLGFAAEDAALQFARFETLQKQNDSIKKVQKRIKEIVRELDQAIEDGDLEKAKNLQNLIGMYMTVQPVWAQDQMLDAMTTEIGTMFDRTMGVAIERGYGTLNKPYETEEDQ